MNKTLKIYLFVFAVLIAVMIMVDQTRPKPLNWYPGYYLNQKNPMDLYVLDKQIDYLFNDSVIRYTKSPYVYFHQEKDSLNTRKETFLFISAWSYVDESSLNKILDAVTRGSTLFIASEGFDSYLTDSLGAISSYVGYSGSDFLNTTIGSRPEVKLTFSREEWSDDEYVYSPVFGKYTFVSADSTISRALGYTTFPDQSKYINFMEFSFGEGKIFLHNQPVAFTNYSLMSDKGLQSYAERVLSYLPDQRVVWFVSSQHDSDRARRNQLSVIFDYPALRMTWLIFLYGLIVFIFFTAKRKQRVVPVIKPLKNTTVEFAQTIGNLYFQEGDISDIARKKIIYFLDRVRRTYHIDTELTDETLVNRLSLKSGKEEKLIHDIITLIKEIERYGLCDKDELVRLSTLMDRFWSRD